MCDLAPHARTRPHAAARVEPTALLAYGARPRSAGAPMMKRPTHFLFASLLALAALSATACGSSSSSPDAMPDAHRADASPPPPDAAIDIGPPPSRTGLIELSELTITNPGWSTIGGAGVAVSWTDDATGTDPVPGYENSTGGCRIVVYDVGGGDSPAEQTDEGRVSVTGTNIGDFQCEFAAAESGYVCRSTDSAYSGDIPTEGSSAVPGDDDVTYVIAGADFLAGGISYVGMHVVILGFDQADANGTFPIVDVPAADTLVVINPDLEGAATLTTTGAYVTRVGLGPALEGGLDFLDDGTEEIAIDKPNSTAVPALDVTLNANGDGITMAPPQLHLIPTTGDAVTLGCDPCGQTGGGLLNTVVVAGRTTDADLTDLDDTAMPAAVSKYAEFRCSAIGAGSIELDEDAMAAILGTLPTRIETQLLYSATDKIGNTSVNVGHGFVGYTTIAD